jgi:hypothetical protein
MEAEQKGEIQEVLPNVDRALNSAHSLQKKRSSSIDPIRNTCLSSYLLLLRRAPQLSRPGIRLDAVASQVWWRLRHVDSHFKQYAAGGIDAPEEYVSTMSVVGDVLEGTSEDRGPRKARFWRSRLALQNDTFSELRGEVPERIRGD